LVSPRVSVITPVWNAAATLGETVASVQAQSVGDWEMLLVDDGSTDGSRALAEALAAADPRLRVLGWSQNHGPAAARNAAIRAAQGRYIAFLDADDRWRPEKLARQVGYMEQTGVPFTFTAYQRIDPEGRPLGPVVPPVRLTYRELLRGNVVGCLTAVYDARALGKMEMPDLRRRQDFGLWLALLRFGAEAHGLSEELADYRVRPGSLSADRLAALAANWRLLREVERLSPPQAGFYLLHHVARALRGSATRTG
jgi:teichuronic acid biosynthesis glycosyltransferase TuaG